VKCPECGKPADTLETRDKGPYIRRRYQCFNEHRFSTIEQVHLFRAGGGEQSPMSRDRQTIRRIKELLK
jgi:transcriptional regulator NrdR family protein